jgi:hypothetical protein
VATMVTRHCRLALNSVAKSLVYKKKWNTDPTAVGPRFEGWLLDKT